MARPWADTSSSTRIERASIDPAEVEDVHHGLRQPRGRDRRQHRAPDRAARRAARSPSPAHDREPLLLLGPADDRASPRSASSRAKADIIVAGGVESISCVQNEANKHMIREDWLVEHKPEVYWTMLQTAEKVAKRYKISREAQDDYGVEQPAAGPPRRAQRASSRTRSCRSPPSMERDRQEYRRRDAARRHLVRGRGHPRRHHLRGRVARSSPRSRAA